MLNIVTVFVRLWRQLWLWAPPLFYAALIFHFSSEANPLPALTTTIWDKALHATEYAGFAVLLFRALRGEGVGAGWSIVLAFLIATVYAASDEWHQLWVPGRDSSVLDWTADTIGAALGSALLPSWRDAEPGLMRRRIV